MLELIILFVVINFLINSTLDYLNAKTWQDKRPENLKDLISEEDYLKSKNYSKDKGKVSIKLTLIQLFTTLILLSSGALGYFSDYLFTLTQNTTIHTAIFFGAYALLTSLLSLKFEYDMNFKVEEKYGFNKMTPKIFFSDKIKGTALMIVIGLPLLSAFIYFYNSSPQKYWIYAWILLTAFSLFLMMTYTSLIVPLFNKLSPLEGGSLKEKIENFGQKVNFPLDRIMVIDGSKRSTKANAFFSGFGKLKNIVLYDTLIEKHTEDEIVAILAHEVGHYKKKHTRSMFVLSSLSMLLTLFTLSLMTSYFSSELATSLGANQSSLALSLVAFGILYSPLSTITQLLMNSLSRKNEFEADAYAKTHSSGKDLASALKSLSVKHLSNLHPHPLYTKFHYTHPPVIERMKSLSS